jgi:LCP family protein required for cell wall assembly
VEGAGGPLTGDDRAAPPSRGLLARIVHAPRWALAVASVTALVVVAAVVDVVLVATNIQHVTVRFPSGGSGSTTVIIGSDSRSAIPTGVPQGVFGSVEQVPDQQADVVLVVHQTSHGTWLLSVPRDILVSPSPGTFERLTLAMGDGPQQVVDGLCRTFGVGADHLVIVDFRGFADIVNRLGGVTVHLAHPTRDREASLSIPRSGTVHLDGVDALALVRSRHPQWLVDGSWVDAPGGATQRTNWAGQVLSAVLRAAQGIGFDPIRLQELAWTASNSLTTDQGTGLTDLMDLARVHGRIEPLPAASVANSLALESDGATSRSLAAAGYTGRCTPR